MIHFIFCVNYPFKITKNPKVCPNLTGWIKAIVVVLYSTVLYSIFILWRSSWFSPPQSIDLYSPYWTQQENLSSYFGNGNLTLYQNCLFNKSNQKYLQTVKYITVNYIAQQYAYAK